jgi:hypothetical protein
LEKMKSSLRREKVKWAGRGRPALPGRKVGRIRPGPPTYPPDGGLGEDEE